MEYPSLEKRRAFLINLFFILSILALVYFVIVYALPWSTPFLIAYVMAFVAEPLVKWMTKHLHIKRGVASPVALCIVFALLAWLLIFVFSRLTYEAAAFAESWTSVYKVISTKTAEFGQSLQDHMDLLPPYVTDYLEDLLSKIVAGLPELIGNFTMSVMTAVTGFAVRLPSLLIVSLVVLAACLLFSVDFNKLQRFLLAQVPHKAQGAVYEAFSYFKLTIFRFIRAYGIICFITFCELQIGFLIIGIDYSMTLATFIALVDVLPILGCGTVLIPWAIAAIVFGNLALGLELLLLSGAITAVRQVLEPKVVGGTTGLHPIAALITIYTGLNFFGIFGMFLVPIAVIVAKHLQDQGYIHIWNKLPEDKAPAQPTEQPAEGASS